MGIGLLTVAMLLAGDLRVIQGSVVLAALPFSAVLVMMAAGLFTALRYEPAGPKPGVKKRRPRQPWCGSDEPEDEQPATSS